jgi:hypothetical protein
MYLFVTLQKNTEKMRESLIDKGNNEDKSAEKAACFCRQKRRFLCQLTFISIESFGYSTYFIYLCTGVLKKG